MAYECRIERDSVYVGGRRASSFVITAPRVVLAELVTHRRNRDTWGEFAFCERTTDDSISKNSASSRAIPFNKMVQKIKDDPFMPMWTIQQKGMQGAVMQDEEKIRKANEEWLAARDNMITHTEGLVYWGIHKQDANRLLEPWAWVTQIVTSSHWDNFFALRCHEAAFPPFRRIARMMFLARKKSTPTRLDVGQWHLPFVPMEEQEAFRWVPDVVQLTRKVYPELPDLIKHSAVRCAWTSYENHDRDASPEAMLSTWNRLFAEIPVHASPVEHQLTPMFPTWEQNLPWLRSNVTGWLQARKLIKMEEITEYNPSQAEIDSWDED